MVKNMSKILITKQVFKNNGETILKDINKNANIYSISGNDLINNKDLSFKLINFLNNESSFAGDISKINLVYEDMKKNQNTSYFVIAEYDEKIIGSIRYDKKEGYKTFSEFLDKNKIILDKNKIELIKNEIDVLNKNDIIIEIGGFYIDKNFRGTVISNKLLFEIMLLLNNQKYKNVYLTTNPDKKTTDILRHFFGDSNIKLLILKDADGYSDNIVEKDLLITRDYSVIMILDIELALKNMINVLKNSNEISKEKNKSLILEIEKNNYNF